MSVAHVGPLRIEILLVKDCPNRVPTVDLVRRTAIALKLEASDGTVEVKTPEDALRLQFLGSPTVRINGLDIDPAVRDRTDFALGCRLYGASGVPPSTLLRAAIIEALE